MPKSNQTHTYTHTHNYRSFVVDGCCWWLIHFGNDFVSCTTFVRRNATVKFGPINCKATNQNWNFFEIYNIAVDI